MTVKVRDSLQRAQSRYDAQQRKVMIRLDKRTDQDIIEKLEREESMQAYIKALIRKDLEK